MTMQVGELVVDVSDLPGKIIRCDFRGKSNHRQPESLLRPLFAEMTRKALDSGAAIEMHFEELEFFNSSTITAVIQFVKELRNRRVTLVVTYSADHKWQKVFFDAMGMLQKSDGLLKIQPIAT
jgi:hypothetical protein